MEKELTHLKIVKEIVDCNIIKVTLEHNGLKGGDSGHGGYVKIIIENITSTDMRLNGKEVDKIEIDLGGDSEHQTFKQAFELLAKYL